MNFVKKRLEILLQLVKRKDGDDAKKYSVIGSSSAEF